MWCWWCCHEFNTTPLALPYKYDDRRNTFYTTGNFCSWSCIKSFAIDKYGLSKGGLICGNIVMMRRKKYNKIGPIQKAPSRFRLKEFGGDLTIEEFRSNLTHDAVVEEKHINEQPHVDNIIPFVSNVQKMNDIHNNTSNNNALKLKRTKPLKRSHNDLGSVLGLVMK